MATGLSTYREFAPPDALAAYVMCAWEQRIGDAPEPYEQPVFPDGCVDLVADDRGGFVAGPATGPAIAALPPGSLTVGLRLRPGAAAAVLGASVHDLVDQSVPFDELWSRSGSTVSARVRDDLTSGRERRTALADIVVQRLGTGATIDREVAAASALLAADPARSLDNLCDATNLSARQLRRRVTEAVGYSPRLLAGILRFQRFLRTVREVAPGDRDLARIAIDTGYADQPHLTRECRRFTGMTPVGLLTDEARRLGEPDGDAWPERSRRADVR
jgi:AraC-like DNA-binding protein